MPAERRALSSLLAAVRKEQQAQADAESYYKDLGHDFPFKTLKACLQKTAERHGGLIHLVPSLAAVGALLVAAVGVLPHRIALAVRHLDRPVQVLVVGVPIASAVHLVAVRERVRVIVGRSIGGLL